MKSYLLLLFLLLSSPAIYSQSRVITPQENDANTTNQHTTFPEWLGHFSIGYSSLGGDYYRSFNSGMVTRLGVRYFLPDSDPTSGRYMLGFSYRHSSFDGEQYMGYTPKLYLNGYTIEFGRTTSLISDQYFLYLMGGVGMLSNHFEIPQSTVIATYSDTKLAGNLEAGGTLLLGKKFSATLDAGYFIVLGDNSATNTTPGQSSLSVAGGGISFSLGVGYAF